MKLTGEDLSEALREWVKNGYKEFGKSAYDQGKFLFTVSSSSIAVWISLQKVSGGERNLLGSIPYFMFLISLLLALPLILPHVNRMEGGANLKDLYDAELKRYQIWTWWWFGVWVVGLLSAIAHEILS